MLLDPPVESKRSGCCVAVTMGEHVAYLRVITEQIDQIAAVFGLAAQALR